MQLQVFLDRTFNAHYRANRQGKERPATRSFIREVEPQALTHTVTTCSSNHAVLALTRKRIF